MGTGHEVTIFSEGHKDKKSNKLLNNFRFKSWVPDHFPQMTVEILEIARINPPGAIMCLIGYGGSRLPGLLHHHINLCFAFQIMTDGAFCSVWSIQGDSCIKSQVTSGENCQLQAML